MMRRLGLMIHHFLQDPLGSITSRRGMIRCGVLLLVVAWLRWPRLNAEMINVWPSQLNQKTLVDEYRATKPFRVRFAHTVHGRMIPRDLGNGWYTESYESYQELSEQFIDCRYDWLRGEYYARLTYQKNELRPEVSFADQQVSFTPFLAGSNSSFKWKPSSRNGHCFIGCDKKQDLAYDPKTEQSENILVYAEFLNNR